MRLTKKALKAVAADQNITAELIRATGKSYPTIRRWINNNDEHLTTATSLEIICTELNVSREEILTNS